MSQKPDHLHTSDCTCLSRRSILRWTGGLASAISLAPGYSFAKGTADAVVLGCMDYRLVDDSASYFTKRGMANKYDQLVLAGGSIGALGKLGEEWSATFWKHVDTAIKLHHVHQLIVLDHRDCGAYKLVFGEQSIAERDAESALHRTQMTLLQGQVKERFPQLATEMLLMNLDGTVEVLIAADKAATAASRAPRMGTPVPNNAH